jgi:hypothetical protein
MSKTRKSIIAVQGTQITVVSHQEGDYISLTDMLKAKDGDFFISDWLRNRNTVEFLGIWESVHNPNFNYGEFAIIRSQAGLNSYKISVKEWVDKTRAIGLNATAGRYGGTYECRTDSYGAVRRGTTQAPERDRHPPDAGTHNVARAETTQRIATATGRRAGLQPEVFKWNLEPKQLTVKS